MNDSSTSLDSNLLAALQGVETNIQRRWEEGMEHHPSTLKLFAALQYIDFKYGSDYFCWKSGGDGDNGEHLMYEMDIYFEAQDKLNEEKTQ